MRKILAFQKGYIQMLPLLIIVAAVGILSFLLISSTAPLGQGLFSSLYPKSSSHAATTINGVPMCDGQNGRPAHDPTKWHPLVAKDSAGNVICTYGHEHGIDPHQFDSVFGGFPLQDDISYPWHTVSSTGVAENSVPLKHRVYKWIGAANMTCPGRAADGSGRMVTAFREELHADGNLGATVRFHSFWGQYQVIDCNNNPSNVGYISLGGVIDYNHLVLGSPPVNLPLTSDAPASCLQGGNSRHEVNLGGAPANGVWYGGNSGNTVSGSTTPCDDAVGYVKAVGLELGFGTDSFGPIDPNNPTALLFYPSNLWGLHTETRIGTDSLTLDIANPALWKPYTDSTGHINFTGHVNRFGAVVPEVQGQPEGPDYIPLVIQNAEPGVYGTSFGPFNPVTPAIGYNGDVPGPQGQAGYYVEAPSLANNTPYPTPTPGVTATPGATSTPTPTSTIIPSPTPSPTSTPTSTPTSCSLGSLGDINCDGKIDIFDYNLLISNFGKSGTGLLGDLNNNGKVDIFDYNILIAHFG